MGKLYDDRGNRMSPSFSTKNGVRYRFYVSSALLRGRKTAAGSVSRIAAAEIETAVFAVLKVHQKEHVFEAASDLIAMLHRVVVSRDQLLIRIRTSDEDDPLKRSELRGLVRHSMLQPWWTARAHRRACTTKF